MGDGEGGQWRENRKRRAMGIQAEAFSSLSLSLLPLYVSYLFLFLFLFFLFFEGKYVQPKIGIVADKTNAILIILVHVWLGGVPCCLLPAALSKQLST